MLEGINDKVVQGIDKSFATLVTEAKKLKKALAIDSYGDLGKQSNQQALQKLETAFTKATALRLNHSRKWPEIANDDGVAQAVYEALVIYQLWPQPIGPGKPLVSSIALQTFPLYKPHKIPNLNSAIRNTAHSLNMPKTLISASRSKLAKAKARIERRKAIIAWLLKFARIKPGQAPKMHQIKRLANALIPHHPFPPETLDLVVVNTMLFICLPNKKRLEQAHQEGLLSTKELATACAYLKAKKRVRFEQFSQFPGLSRFDARDADDALIARLAQHLNLGSGATCEWLSSVVMMEDAADIEKFLIHDTWGHLWQADLTDLKGHYDQMVALQLPISPDTTVTIDGDNIVSMSDLFYIRADKQVILFDDMAQAYGDQLNMTKIRSLFAPLIAEMCADMIEYRFSHEMRALGDILPSSSSFANRSTKLDFAWADLYYFVKMLRNSDDTYLKNPELVHTLATRLAQIHQFRHADVWGGSGTDSQLRRDFEKVVKEFLKTFIRSQKQQLAPDLEVNLRQGKLQINAFFQIYINMLRIQTTLNHLFHNEIEAKRPYLLPYREYFILFIARYFCLEPLHHFFALDEVISRDGLAILEGVHRMAKTS